MAANGSPSVFRGEYSRGSALLGLSTMTTGRGGSGAQGRPPPGPRLTRCVRTPWVPIRGKLTVGIITLTHRHILVHGQKTRSTNFGVAGNNEITKAAPNKHHVRRTGTSSRILDIDSDQPTDYVTAAEHLYKHSPGATTSSKSPRATCADPDILRTRYRRRKIENYMEN